MHSDREEVLLIERSILGALLALRLGALYNAECSETPCQAATSHPAAASLGAALEWRGTRPSRVPLRKPAKSPVRIQPALLISERRTPAQGGGRGACGGDSIRLFCDLPLPHSPDHAAGM